MHNLVTEFDKDRTIAWVPGQLDEQGRHEPGGWWWRYDLSPNGEQTDVTITYDWTGAPQSFRDQIGGMPRDSNLQYIAESLAALERSVK